MVKLKMFWGRWLITLDHWLMNLPSTNSHMDLTARLCVVSFSIMKLTSDEWMCFNASHVALNWSYWILILLVDLWISRILWLLDFQYLFLNFIWHWVCLVDGNISPCRNLYLDWVTIFKVPFTGVSSHSLKYCETILLMLFFIHVLGILVPVRCQLIFDNVHCWQSFSLLFGWSGSLSMILIWSVVVSINSLLCFSSAILKSKWRPG